MFQHKLALPVESTTIAAGANASISAFDWTAFQWDSFFYSTAGTPNYAHFDLVMARRIRLKSLYFDGYWTGVQLVRDLQDTSFLKIAEISPVEVNEWLDINAVIPGFGNTSLSGDYVHLKLTGTIYLENNLSASHTEAPKFEIETVYGEM